MGAAEKQVIAKYLTQPLEGLADGRLREALFRGKGRNWAFAAVGP